MFQILYNNNYIYSFDFLNQDVYNYEKKEIRIVYEFYKEYIKLLNNFNFNNSLLLSLIITNLINIHINRLEYKKYVNHKDERKCITLLTNINNKLCNCKLINNGISLNMDYNVFNNIK